MGAENDGFRPRIEETLYFTKHLKITKVGFAACNAFENEMRVLRKLFMQEGFDVVCAACQIGWVTAEERGIPKLTDYVNSSCNPIAQELYLKVVFKGKGGVSTGRLLAAVNRPH